MAKQLTIQVRRADREIWDGGALRLEVTDLHQGLRVLFDRAFPGTSNTIRLNLDLPFDAAQVYGLLVDADGHRAAWQFIQRSTFLRVQGGQQVEADNAVLSLLLVPNNPRSVDLDQGYGRLRAEESPAVVGAQPWPEALYDAMGDPAKMAFLNIDAKLRETRINDRSIRSFVEGVSHVAASRVFLFVRPELKDLVDAASEFSKAPGHGAPPDSAIPLPNHPDSWKHNLFVGGNLQLSFSHSTMALPIDPARQVYSVDADIDLESGLNHAVEWLHNEVFHPNEKTDQTLVYSLLFAQGIVPHYTLQPLFG